MSQIAPTAPLAESARLDHLDATRAFALVLGVVFHASLSFMPVFFGWAVQDVSTSPLIAVFMTVSHAFRMELFFLLAGFFAHLTVQRKGAGTFLRSRVVRIVVPFVVGWFLLRPLIVSGWIMGSASMRGDYDVWAGLRGGFQSLASLPAGIFTGSHLWFLYYLALITGLVLAVRWLLGCAPAWSAALATRTDAMVARLTPSPWFLVLAAIPTAGVLWFMDNWGMDTPDRSLRPHVPVLLVYGAFFALGWLFGRSPGLITRFGRLSAARWMLAVAGIAGTLLLSGIHLDPGHPHRAVGKIAYVACYAVMMWALVAVTLGLFERLCRNPNVIVRYVADSSYWMYLIHLPVVVWLQVAVAEIPLHWSLKLAGISAATIALSLVTYDLLVRSTFLGALLNGRRRERVLVRRSRPANRPVAGVKPGFHTLS